jgi:hypothetical protein
MKLTKQDLDIIIELLVQELREINNSPEGTEVYSKPEVITKLIKKLDKMYND